MDFRICPNSPAEARLLAAFINDYADLMEIQQEEWEAKVASGQVPGILGAGVSALNVQAQEAPEQPAAAAAPTEEKAKRTRSKKEEPKQEPAEPPKTEAPAQAPAAGDDNFDEEAAPAAKPEQNPNKVTHDDIRTLLGTLTQANKRDAAVAAIRGQGFNGVSAITEDKLYVVYADLKKLEAGN